jgi:hypothetical protein
MPYCHLLHALFRSKLYFSRVLESVLLRSFAKLPKSIRAMCHLRLSYGKKKNPRFGGTCTCFMNNSLTYFIPLFTHFVISCDMIVLKYLYKLIRTIWHSSRLGVESAPAIVFLKGPGTKPVVWHGKIPSALNSLIFCMVGIQADF